MERHQLKYLIRNLETPFSVKSKLNIKKAYSSQKSTPEKVLQNSRIKSKWIPLDDPFISSGGKVSNLSSSTKRSKELKSGYGKKLPTSSIEERLEILEETLPKVEGTLTETALRIEEIESTLLRFRDDLIMTKRAYSELLHYELLKSDSTLKAEKMEKNEAYFSSPRLIANKRNPENLNLLKQKKVSSPTANKGRSKLRVAKKPSSRRAINNKPLNANHVSNIDAIKKNQDQGVSFKKKLNKKQSAVKLKKKKKVVEK